MNNLTSPFIILAIMFVAVVIGWGKTWKKKEHYRCRVFDLTDGKEGSNLVTVVPTTPPPPPPKKPAAPVQQVGTMQPLLTEWLECYGEYFRRNSIAHLTKNPNGTINVVLVDGHSINTGMTIDEVKDMLHVYYMPSMKEELKRYSRSNTNPKE